MFSIGSHTITSQVLLAPMAGITDAPFRKICRQYGAGLTTSEMVTSDTSLWKSDKSRQRLRYDAELSPISVQIAGSDPQMMSAAAKRCVELGAQIIDINMGCPAKKVCKKLAGSALLQDEALVESILNAVVNSVDVPVTLKTRTGTSPAEKNGVVVAKIAENCGISALAVHGRTRACRFKGEAEYDTIAEIVESVSIPVMANGDIDTPLKAKEILDKTGATALLIGRKALGNPWIFDQINQYLKTGTLVKMPTHEEVRKIMELHLHKLHEFYGETKGVRIARKHIGWYCQNLTIDKTFLKTFNTLENSQSQTNAVTELLERFNSYEEKAA